MSTVIKNPNPKARFQESANNISRHRDLIQSPEFQRACDFALMQYQTELCKLPFNEASATHFRLLGAHEFVQILRNLGESFELPSRNVPAANLNHEA